ncbi:MAG: outer membrane beta-barrel protein [Elusimicrobia bacterium]|nr:outer membrane beta-barrel protein [Elusimicrobiota bacterium]
MIFYSGISSYFAKETPNEIAKVQNYSYYSKEVTLDKGKEDGIRSRQLYNVYNKENEKIAKIAITAVSQTTSVGKIMRRYNKKIPSKDDVLKYTGNRMKTCEIGGTGLLYGFPGGSMFSLAGGSAGGEGGAGYYEYKGISGLGFRVGLGYFEDTNGGWSNQYSEKIFYSYPILCKYHFFNDTNFSPYVGLGITYNEITIATTDKINDLIVGSNSKTYSGFVPTTNIGFNIYALRTFQFGLDYQYLLRVKNKYNNTYFAILSAQVSVNW